MSDDNRNADADLERRLASLPTEKAPESNLWSEVTAGIHDSFIESRLDGLPKEVEPHSDLWPEVAARIQIIGNPMARARARRLRTNTLLAACVSLIAVGGLLLYRPIGVDDGSPALTGANPDDAQATIADASFTSLDFPAELLFPIRSDGTVNDAQVVFQNHIALVREERETIEESLLRFPNDTALRALWLHAYKTELALIDEAGRALTTI